MKRVFVAFCALVSMIVVGCQSGSAETDVNATLEFYYLSQTTLYDTVSISDEVSDVEGKIDSIVYAELTSKNVIGNAFFGAMGSDVYAVDSVINLQAETFYNELLASIAGFNFDSLLENKVDYYEGGVMVEYNLTIAATNYVSQNDTVATFYLGDGSY